MTPTFPGRYSGSAPVAPVETMEQATYLEDVTEPRIRIARLPSKEHLEYTKELITTGLLIIALPWIIRFLFVNPRGFAKSLSSVTP
jgi:hypothetical protein